MNNRVISIAIADGFVWLLRINGQLRGWRGCLPICYGEHRRVATVIVGKTKYHILFCYAHDWDSKVKWEGVLHQAVRLDSWEIKHHQLGVVESSCIPDLLGNGALIRPPEASRPRVRGLRGREVQYLLRF